MREKKMNATDDDDDDEVNEINNSEIQNNLSNESKITLSDFITSSQVRISWLCFILK